MDAPPIRYATTEDGVRIAYTTAGRGPALVHLSPTDFGHCAEERLIPEYERWYDRLTSAFTLVRFDHRGFGSSDRSPVLSRLEDRTRDIEAVVRALAVERVVILGWLSGSPSAIRFAARYPELVSHLVLLSGSARASDINQAPRSPGVGRLMREDWGAYTELRGLRAFGWDRGETGRRYAEMMYNAASPEAIAGHQAIVDDFDVSDDLARIQAKTLIAQQGSAITSEGTSMLASRIPNATMLTWPHAQWEPWWDEETADAGFKLIRDFVVETDEPVRAGADQPQALQTILFTDLEASTAVTQRLGDEGAQDLLRGHNTTVRTALHDHDGREVKHTGDGIMASFPSAVAAVTAALQIQRELADGEVRVRVGLNAGEPIAEDHDLFGTAVQLAARVTDRAEPGQVLVTRVVADLCAGKSLTFSSLGSVSLKGFDEAVELFEVSG